MATARFSLYLASFSSSSLLSFIIKMIYIYIYIYMYMYVWRHICFALLFFSSQTHFHFIILFHTYKWNISFNFSITFTISAKIFQMAFLQLLKFTFTSISTSHPRKFSSVFWESDSRKRVLRFSSSTSRNSRKHNLVIYLYIGQLQYGPKFNGIHENGLE